MAARAIPDISGDDGDVVCSVSRARTFANILREPGGGAETRPLPGPGDARNVEVSGAETGPVMRGGEG